MKGLDKKELGEIVSGLEELKDRLVAVKEGMESYADERSEKWRDSDAGQEYDEKIGELDEYIGELADAISNIDSFGD